MPPKTPMVAIGDRVFEMPQPQPPMVATRTRPRMKTVAGLATAQPVATKRLAAIVFVDRLTSAAAALRERLPTNESLRRCWA